MSITKYKLAHDQAQKRLAELSESSREDLRDEIALCRFLLEASVDNNSPASIAILQTCAKLSQADLQNRIRSRDLLAREDAMKLADQLVSIVIDEVGMISGCEEIVSRIAQRIESVMEENKRDK